MKNIKKGFTFVEIVVVVSIIGILSTMGFYSFIDFISDSRDSQRKSDLTMVSSALKTAKQKKGFFTPPGDSIVITNNNRPVAYQGKLNKKVFFNTVDKLPTDPKIGVSYVYSTTKNKQEFQIAGTLENGDNNISILEGNYKTVSQNVLPSIILASNNSSGLEIYEGVGSGPTNRKLFIFDNSKYNLPYTFTKPYYPFTDDKPFEFLLSDENINYLQSSDYRNCTEIAEAGKDIFSGSGEYQIISSSGTLTNTGCTF